MADEDKAAEQRRLAAERAEERRKAAIRDQQRKAEADRRKQEQLDNAWKARQRQKKGK